jgi:hypothetical protein
MNPPECVRRTTQNKPLWYKTNIPIPANKEHLQVLYKHWNNRWQALYGKAMIRGSYDWLSFRMIYSRLVEIRETLEYYEP